MANERGKEGKVEIASQEPSILKKPAIFFDQVMQLVDATNDFRGEERANNGRKFLKWVKGQWQAVNSIIKEKSFITGKNILDQVVTMRRAERDGLFIIEHQNTNDEYDDVVEVIDCDPETHGRHIKFEVSHKNRSVIKRVEYSEALGEANSVTSKGTKYRTASVSIFGRERFSLQYHDGISGHFNYPKEFDF